MTTLDIVIPAHEKDFAVLEHAVRGVLRYVQPGLVGLIDGTLSTLAPIFAAALLSGSHAALFVGVATALGAGISMGFSEALSDTGSQTGRGSALARGLMRATGCQRRQSDAQDETPGN